MTLRQLANRIMPIYRRGRTEYFEGAGRDHIVFVHPPKRVRIFVELCSDGRAVSLRRVGTHWETPHHEEALSESARRDIFRKLCEYYDLIGQSYTVTDVTPEV